MLTSKAVHSSIIYSVSSILTVAVQYIEKTMDKKHWVLYQAPCSKFGRTTNATGEAANYFLHRLRPQNPTEAIRSFIVAVSDKMVRSQHKQEERMKEQTLRVTRPGFVGYTNVATHIIREQMKVSQRYARKQVVT